MKASYVFVGLCIIGILLAVRADADTTEIEELRTEVAALRERVSDLEVSIRGQYGPAVDHPPVIHAPRKPSPFKADPEPPKALCVDERDCWTDIAEPGDWFCPLMFECEKITEGTWNVKWKRGHVLVRTTPADWGVAVKQRRNTDN